MPESLKLLALIHSLIPQPFFKHMEILVPEVGSFLDSLGLLKWHTQNLYDTGEITEN